MTALLDSAAPPAPRKLGLDVIRSAAILLVIAHHFRHLHGSPEWFDWFALRAYIGVDLFFVLSGWLIGGQLVREVRRTGTVALGRFWVRRWFRTIPAYLVVLAILLAQGRIPLADAPAMLVFAQNYVAPDSWLITWSLCIEEHFYLVLPLAFLVATRLSRRACWLLIVAALVLSPALRWMAHADMAAGTYREFLARFYSPTHLRLEGLVLGVAAAAVAAFHHARWEVLVRHRLALLALGVALVVGATWAPWVAGFTGAPEERMAFFPAVLGFVLVSTGTAAMLPLASRDAHASRWLAAPFVFVAEHAYALYLTHQQVGGEVNHLLRKTGAPFGVIFAVAVAASFGCAWLLRRFVEVPGLALRDRLLERLGRRAIGVAQSGSRPSRTYPVSSA